MRARLGRFLRRRIADVALVVAWVLAVFQLVQLRGVQDESTTETVLTVVIALALGLAATALWMRSRRRS